MSSRRAFNGIVQLSLWHRMLTPSQKALNLFNAALVTPTYYVYFTSTTIITSAILFQGFKGTVESIITVVLGFFVICAGVVLLQLSKSAKDVPDAAVFKGDLDQIQTIAEQEQPETEPKADAIRGTAAILRRISQSRNRMEAEELKRLHQEKMEATMEPIGEEGQAQYEWDGLRRRKTVAPSTSTRSRSVTTPWPSPYARSPHPPLGMSQFPSDGEDEHEEEGNIFSSIAGTIRGRGRRHTIAPGHEDEHHEDYDADKMRSPMHPVPLTEIAVPRHSPEDESSGYYGRTRQQSYLGQHSQGYHPEDDFDDDDTEYHGAAAPSTPSLAPTPPPHSARRQFSFQKVFRRTPVPSEEERVGLVKEAEAPGDRAGDKEYDEHGGHGVGGGGGGSGSAFV